MDCVWQVRGGHAPLGPVQRRPGEVRPLPSHRVGGGAVLRLQGAGPEQGGCEPGFPCVRGCGCHGSVRQSSPPRWRAASEPRAAAWTKSTATIFLLTSFSVCVARGSAGPSAPWTGIIKFTEEDSTGTTAFFTPWAVKTTLFKLCWGCHKEKGENKNQSTNASIKYK